MPINDVVIVNVIFDHIVNNIGVGMLRLVNGTDNDIDTYTTLSMTLSMTFNLAVSLTFECLELIGPHWLMVNT